MGMLWPDTCKVCDSPVPKSFSALMELYEQNYLRLRCLCPQIKELEGEHISRASNCLDLRLAVVDQTRHTTTIRLTYLMSGSDLRPDALVRIYHDALQAEILSRECRIDSPRISPETSGMESTLLCKWRMNRFLYKWLNYLQRQGHGYAPVPEVPPAATELSSVGECLKLRA